MEMNTPGKPNFVFKVPASMALYGLLQFLIRRHVVGTTTSDGHCVVVLTAGDRRGISGGPYYGGRGRMYGGAQPALLRRPLQPGGRGGHPFVVDARVLGQVVGS